MESAAVPRGVEITRWIATGCAGAMIVLALAWHAAQPGGPGWGLLALQVLPLAAALPGLWRRRMYTYRWVSLLVWLYFLFATVTATSSRGPVVLRALAEVALSLALFAACALHVRLRLKKKPAHD